MGLIDLFLPSESVNMTNTEKNFVSQNLFEKIKENITTNSTKIDIGVDAKNVIKLVFKGGLRNCDIVNLRQEINVTNDIFVYKFDWCICKCCFKCLFN